MNDNGGAEPGHCQMRICARLQTAGLPVALPYVRVAVRAIAADVALVAAKIPLILANLPLLGASPRIPPFGASQIAMLDGAVFAPLIIVALGAVAGEPALVLSDVAPVRADVAIVVADIPV